MLTLKLRKKLTTTIAGILVTLLGTFLASKGFDLSPDQQLILVEIAGVLITILIASFNIGQGIADKGKELPFPEDKS